MRSTIGCYRGVHYAHQRLCDAFYGDNRKSRWWFVLNDSRRPTGDHYRTLRDLKEAVDAGTGSILAND